MSAVFLKVLNMSMTASWLILAVVLTRLILKKAPKWIPCLLWGLVAIRLICPFSFESVLSLIPSSETIPANIALQPEPAINSGITIVNEAVNPVVAESFTPAPTDSANPLQIVIPVAAILWIAGIVIMLAYALISYLKLKKTVSVCVPVGERLLACDEVKAPFILGVFRPVIYVPSSMSGKTLAHVIRHERAHLQRHDHWWKPLGFLLLSVYWFNPLCWIAYILLCRDIEMACDEKVIRDMDKDDMAAYSQALLDCSFPRKRIAACPLAFGEVGVKERVKGVLNYKKPAFWIIVVAVAACVVTGVCFLTNPAGTALTKWGTDEADMNKALIDVQSFSVQYLNNEVACNDSDMNRFIATMSKIKVDRRPVSKSRDEGRSKAFTITINEQLKLNFNERFDEIWVDNGVKPSYTYRITNPSVAEELLLDFNFTAKTGVAEIDMDSLRVKYPEYFELSTFKGLELYVWQMAPDSYSCGLMLGTNRNKTLEELINLKGASIAEMRAILSTYDIDEKDVIIIPWQNPVSSYIAEYWISQKDEDPAVVEKRKQAYIDGIRQMLFGTAQSGSYDLPNPIVEIKTAVAYANWTEDSRVFADCSNAGMMTISSVPHLPVYKLDTLKDLEQFQEKFRDILTLDHGYDEVPSFDDITALYDDSFFADHTLILAYVTAPSGSFRYAIQDISYAGSTFCLDVVQTNDPETYTDDMAGWFVIAEVLDSDIADDILFDARLVERK